MADDDTQPIADIQAEGWDWFDEHEKKGKEAFKTKTGLEPDEILMHFQKCFGTASGQIVKNYLESLAFDQPDFDPTHGFYDGAAFGYYRAGQKSIVREIRSILSTKPK